MHLVPFHPPAGILEVAPRTSLGEDTADARWEGFWCLDDDRYYARRSRANGVVEWFRYAEGRARVRRWREARVLPIRRARMMIVGRYGRRAIFVRSVR